ncbi:MAG: D-alanine--D-alanine ligase family protein [Planctomycetota bacterium]|jgi:D-alanine-D-alanine ligase
MKSLRILILVDRDLVPPETYDGDYTDEPWKTEYDVQVSLRNMGHEVRVLGVLRDIERIRQVYEEWQPHIAFNLLEDVYGVIHYTQNVVGYLELLGLPYTGCNPLGLQLSRDKALSKELLPYHRIRTPRFIVCRREHKVRRPAGFPFPAIVKSLIEDASSGLSRRSVVQSDGELVERVKFMHEHLNTDAIVEEFIDGREFYVGVLGNQRLDVFPPWELIAENLPEDMPLIATQHLKFNKAYREKLGVVTRRAQELPDGAEAHLAKLTRRIYRILKLSGYARMDFRLSNSGQIYLLEANANPAISFGEDLAESAESAGVSYEQLLQRILNLGLRWHDDHAVE